MALLTMALLAMHLVVEAQHHCLAPAAVCRALEIHHLVGAAHLTAALAHAAQAPALAPNGGGTGRAVVLLPPCLTHRLAHALAEPWVLRWRRWR